MPGDVVAAADLLRLAADPAWWEAPIADNTSPLTIVEIGRDAPAALVDVPPAAPRVLVALCRDGAGPDFAPSCDAVVTDDAHIDEITTTCAAAPGAATALAQLLRCAHEGSVADGLWRESVVYSMLLAGPEFARWLAQRPMRPPRSGESDGAPVVIERDGDRVDIVLARPEVHNAYSAAMRDALIDALRAFAALDAHGADLPAEIRIRGRGPSFCSGGDLDEFGTTPDVVTAHGIRTSRSPGVLLDALGSRATAAVHGACIGAGTELAAFCAHVRAAPDAVFQLPEVAMGLVPGAGGTVSVTRRIGRHRCALLALTGRPIDAPTALDWGLVDTVVP